MNNAVKHAKADNITVTLAETAEAVAVTIADDGVGFDVKNVLNNYETRGSLGMINIRERAESIGGDFSIDSEAGKGTTISIDIPKEKAEKDRRIKTRTVTGMLNLPANFSQNRD